MPDIPASSPIEAARLAELQAQRAKLESRIMRQLEEAEEDFQMWSEQGFDAVPRRKFKTLDELQKYRPTPKAEKEEKTEEEKKVEKQKQIEDTAAKFEQRNGELKAKTLQILLSRLSPNDDLETILAKVLEVYSDYSLADDALEFILQTSGGKLKEAAQQAKDALNARYGREIAAGKNIVAEAREFSRAGLGSPTALRDMYRDITGSRRDAIKLFDELFATYTYSKMKKAIDFLLHSLGSDLKAKGPSISRGELQSLIEDARSLLALLGIYGFFESRTKLIFSQFHQYGLNVPTQLTFEALARQLIQLLKERYLSPDKVLQLAKNLGLLEEIVGQIVVFTQMRDAVRQIAPRLYRNNKHKEDLLESIIEALEELEEELEENEEE